MFSELGQLTTIRDTEAAELMIMLLKNQLMLEAFYLITPYSDVLIPASH